MERIARRQVGEHLVAELLEPAARDDADLRDGEQLAEQRRHPGIDGRLRGGERVIEVEGDEVDGHDRPVSQGT
ncbi:hypothetical protein GCM10009840_13070 [Pseudolysinimonas kribbensis]|uniref:Uncharacterized protein n=1 Tax=Pseudolysinimonas kribbensis TaxID=433641 RepID=A0ABQ6K4B8_9MICO|nr:hypothetical protein GCM10025881_12240 [Pseudolysinimonas kribbensis]